MGSNTFRLVVFRYRPGGAFQLTEEVRETVRLSAGQREGVLAEEAIARGSAAADLYAAFCAASGINEVDAVATSAVRDAPNRREVVEALSAAGALPVRVLSAEEEAWYGYLGAINSTSLREGVVCDIGGGSLQLARVDGRTLTQADSWPLGAVRMTEAYLAEAEPSAGDLRALRAHIRRTIGPSDWLHPGDGGLVAVGGSVRTLAIMAQRASVYPLDEIHGYRLTRASLGELIATLAALPPRRRSEIPGLKVDRADIILAAAIAVDEVMSLLDAESLEVCGQGLRWGVFYERILGPERPLFDDVRATSVRNVAEVYRYDRVHADHVASLALQLYDELSRLGVHVADPVERELLWAASVLHDVGVMVDYNDHHRHGEYLVLNAGLPGFDHRELALISLLVRGHRKSVPSLAAYSVLLAPGDDDRFSRLLACLRLAEQLERGRSQRVRTVRLRDRDGELHLSLDTTGHERVARWAASSEQPIFRRAFDRLLVVSPPRG